MAGVERVVVVPPACAEVTPGLRRTTIGDHSVCNVDKEQIMRVCLVSSV